MELIRGLHNLRDQHRGCVATIGNFDGVHLGHHQVLLQVKEKAVALGLPSVAIIFEPQPQEFFAGEHAPARLTRFRDKVTLLREHQIDRVFCLHFNEALRALTAEEFIDQLLLNGLDVSYFVVGDDFRFGCDRRGNFELLQQYGKSHGFTVVNTRTYELDGDRVSSSRIRNALTSFDFQKAGELLGRPYSIAGRVVHGQKLGRQLGVPTANILLQKKKAPFAGVFAVRAFSDAGVAYDGVANVGTRPTVNGVTPILEVHLFGFDGDLYGQRLDVEFRAFIRPEQRFESVEILKDRIMQDIAEAKALINQFDD
jgi:riboflavin kinase/FMN adenylyltransferase